MTDPQNPGPTGGRRLRILLALSLTLNLVVIGLVAGAMLRASPGSMSLRDEFGPYGAMLDRQDRQALRDRFQDLRRTEGPEAPPQRVDMQDFAAALQADPFDRAAFAAILSTHSDRMARRMENSQRVIVDYVAGLPVEKRREMARRVLARLR